MSRATTRQLTDLLARIHRDGGHYAAEHGIDKACNDAEEIVASLWAKRDAGRKAHMDDIDLAISHLGQVYGLIESGEYDKASDYCRAAAESWTQTIAQGEQTT